MAKQFRFEGKGGSLFGLILGQGLLTMITAGIYAPWAWCRIQRFFLGNLWLDGKKFDFQGKGGRLFVLLLGQGLLTLITCGIYYPWALAKIAAYLYSSTTYDRRPFAFNGRGGELFALLLGQWLLTVITLGIYGPWAACRIIRYASEHSWFDGKRFGFTGRGGEYFLLLLWRGFLTAITFYIYAPWAMAKIMEFMVGNTIYGENERFRFRGQGGELFIIMLKGVLLSGVTFGIYYSWYLVELFRWEAASTTLEPVAGSSGAGWLADPTGRHRLRYWDGLAWTDHVADDGQQSVDPLPRTAAPQAAQTPYSASTTQVAVFRAGTPSPGAAIVFDGTRLLFGGPSGQPLELSLVCQYDQAGYLEWASEEWRQWVWQHRT